MSNWRFFLLSFLLSSLTVLPAQAQDPAVEHLTYDAYADFNLAYPADAVITFEDQGPIDVFYGDVPFQEAGASISATDSYLFVRSNGNRNGFIYGAFGGGLSSSVNHVQIDLPPDTNAFGAHMTGFFVRSVGELMVTLSTGQQFLVQVTGGLWYNSTLDPRDWDHPSFFGVISAEPFDWVRVEVVTTDYLFQTDYVVLDNLAFGHSDMFAPPEPPPAVCGDNVLDAGEECDDGNVEDADGCSSTCVVEVIEEIGYVGAQSKHQRKCIVAMNKYGARLAKAMNKSAYRCIKYAGKSHKSYKSDKSDKSHKSDKSSKSHKLARGGDAQSCLTADVKGRIARAEDKLMDKEEDKCLEDPEDLPDFAYMGSASVMAGADSETWDLLGDVFGDPGSLNSVVVMKDDDRDGRNCQHNTYRYVGKLHHAKLKTFYKCKRNALKGKDRFTDPADFGNSDPDERVESMHELEAEILACVEADPHGRITRHETRLAHKLMDKCELDEMSTPMHRIFPGVCADDAANFGSDPGALMDCLERVTDCHFCRSMNAFDGFEVDCDDYDNGLADLSCS